MVSIFLQTKHINYLISTNLSADVKIQYFSDIVDIQICQQVKELFKSVR